MLRRAAAISGNLFSCDGSGPQPGRWGVALTHNMPPTPPTVPPRPQVSLAGTGPGHVRRPLVHTPWVEVSGGGMGAYLVVPFTLAVTLRGERDRGESAPVAGQGCGWSLAG